MRSDTFCHTPKRGYVMGWRESLSEKVEQQKVEAVARGELQRESVGAVVGSCHDADKHYVTEVNKGSIRMQSWQGHLNDMFQRGYRLAHVFEQDGNTVQVYEHHHP
jgi:hypothetical protein